jgi:hypothetical protein
MTLQPNTPPNEFWNWIQTKVMIKLLSGEKLRVCHRVAERLEMGKKFSTQLSPVLWLLILGNYGVSPKKSN